MSTPGAPPPGGSNGDDVPMIVGVAVGVGGVLILIVVVVCLMKRREQKESMRSNGTQDASVAYDQKMNYNIPHYDGDRQTESDASGVGPSHSEWFRMEHPRRQLLEHDNVEYPPHMKSPSVRSPSRRHNDLDDVPAIKILPGEDLTSYQTYSHDHRVQNPQHLSLILNDDEAKMTNSVEVEKEERPQHVAKGATTLRSPTPPFQVVAWEEVHSANHHSNGEVVIDHPQQQPLPPPPPSQLVPRQATPPQSSLGYLNNLGQEEFISYAPPPSQPPPAQQPPRFLSAPTPVETVKALPQEPVVPYAAAVSVDEDDGFYLIPSARAPGATPGPTPNPPQDGDDFDEFVNVEEGEVIELEEDEDDSIQQFYQPEESDEHDSQL